MDEIDKERLMKMTADIVSAYVSHNAVKSAELPELFAKVYAGVEDIAKATAEMDREKAEPAVPIKESLTDEAIICLEDGRAFQSLKRHLRVKYNLTPQAYRNKWGLPNDYPMVAPNYAKRRSALAKKTGLGKNKRN